MVRIACLRSTVCLASLVVFITDCGYCNLLCGCGISENPGNEFLSYVYSSPGKSSESNYCVNNRTCTAAKDHGCYRLRTTSGSALFCGGSVNVRGSFMGPGNQAGWIINLSTEQFVNNLGICSESNLNGTGLCYCDNKDLCNLSVREREMPITTTTTASSDASHQTLSALLLAAFVSAGAAKLLYFLSDTYLEKLRFVNR